MKSAKKPLLWCLTVACALSLPRVLGAQDNAPAPGQNKPAAESPTPAEVDQALVDDTNKTNAAESPEAVPMAGDDNDVFWRGPKVVFGKDAEVKAGEAVEALFVIGGSAKVYGKVREAAVVILGDLDVYGQVGKAAVAVLGNINAHKGSRIKGDAVAAGGRVEVNPGARVLRAPQGVELPDLRWLRKWFVQCVLLMRPLSLKVTWVWIVAGVFFLFYLLVGSLFPTAVRACVNELTQRPATTFSLGLLTILLFPVAIAILGITGIGLLVVPFVFAAIFFGAIVGRVATLEWIGLRLGNQFGAATLGTPLTGLVLGSLLIAALYLIPFLGLLTFGVISIWSLGGAVTAAFGGLRREMPEKPSAASPALAVPLVPPSGPTAVSGQDQPPTASGPAVQAAPQVGAAPASTSSAPPVVPETLTYPKATFWERLGAAFLDVILVSILCALLHPIAPLIALAYFAGLWAWRGTTIGGIVVGLKVVRLDGKPVTFQVALIRGLAAAFSIVVLFLGFLWIAWDSEKQGWHDKIAGTVVLRLPRGTPLL